MPGTGADDNEASRFFGGSCRDEGLAGSPCWNSLEGLC